MPTLIHPETGEHVYATPEGAEVLKRRGYTEPTPNSSASSPSASAAKTPPAAVDPAWPDTHAGLDAIAESLDGFSWPAPLEGKKKLTVAEKIEALKAAGYTPGS